jgi:glycerophosphoryl diester phosphodiesterase
MTQRPLLLGHRGARAVDSIPENTFASFDRALADGCDGFEFDVRLTADSVPVICHDPHVGKMEVARSAALQLPALPRLTEVLQRYQNTAFLDIELKVPGVERITLDALEAHHPLRGFIVSTFLPEVLRALRSNDSTVPLGLICETKSQLQQWRKLSVDYVLPHYKLVSEDLIRELRHENKKIFVWTVNHPDLIKRFVQWEVNGIISDDTELLVEEVTARE